MDKIKNIITTCIFAGVLIAASILCIIKPADEFSEAERRKLAQMPEINRDTVMSGSFMKDFESYTTDQFPLRDNLRTVKALFATRVLNKWDNNGIFDADGHISKIDDKADENMIEYAVNVFDKIVDKNVKDENTKVYFSVVPDKNMFLADKYGYPSIDYEAFINSMKDKADFMEYIDIIPYLSYEDYYETDTHWRQEKIGDLAQFIVNAMGSDIPTEYKVNSLEKPFYGVYYGQSALPHRGDKLNYVTNEVIDTFSVKYYGTGIGKKGDLYNMDKANGKDPYEMFLSGSEPLVEITNPNADNDRQLIVFRDSFGSSLAPLLAQGYKKTMVVDIRYMMSDFLSAFMKFDNSDVLFIYSTSVLNTATSLK